MSERNDQWVILIVPAADRAVANSDAEAAVPGCGPENFAVGLVPAGSAHGTLPSHYICSWRTTVGVRDRLRARFDRADLGRSYAFRPDSEVPVSASVADLLQGRGLVFRSQTEAIGRSRGGR